MRYYQVYYQISNGNILKENIASDASVKKKEQFRRIIANQLGVPKESIIKYNRIFGTPQSDIRRKDLTVVLYAIESASRIGKNLVDALAITLNDIYNNKGLNNRLDFYVKLSLPLHEVLQRLNVDIAIVELIKSGKHGKGNMINAVESCIAYLDTEDQVKKTAKTGIGKSSLWIGLGLALLLVFPLFFAQELNNILSSMGISNTGQYPIVAVLNYIANNIYAIVSILALIVVVVIAIVNNEQLYTKVKYIYPFLIFTKITEIKQTLNFLPFYIILKRSGMSDEFILNAYTNINPSLAEELLMHYRENKALAETIAQSKIGADIANRLAPIFHISDLETRYKTLQHFISLLSVQIESLAKKVALSIKIVGMVLLGVGGAIVFNAFITMMQISQDISK